MATTTAAGSSLVTFGRKRFNPETLGLPADWRLTKFTQLKGCGCKVPQKDLLKLLEVFRANSNNAVAGSEQQIAAPTPTSGGAAVPASSIPAAITADGTIGVGLDSCVTETRHPGLYLVQTTDFFFPLIEDPYQMGRIACANVLSDLYAMGVSECDNMLMLLGVSTTLTPEESVIVTPLVMKGFHDLCQEAGTNVLGGQTVKNPWFLLGGVATSVVGRHEMIMPDGAKSGDVLVLTKPLGNQLAVNAHQWMLTDPERYKRLDGVLTNEQVIEAYEHAITNMTRLSRVAARLMREFGAHAATDVTGFGILGHARNLARSQKDSVNFEIDVFPVLRHMIAMERATPVFHLLEGTSAETSGGLLIALGPSPDGKLDARANAQRYCDELARQDRGFQAYIIGRVVEGSRDAVLSPNLQIIEVDAPILTV
ncbi:selenophosphate synthetase [Capsaspora owczarzaki ATCC 30864]|uniref:Selenophosphate synthetase n=1 Tax=Capsaspora owczarzaki (strain ATCC 30864) TaxID=595528 RepID=A0A0D2X0B2_CAPO3|nr:selenophosphate synthetase [Capsaspora owczarzaki ATCC 30864]KJE88754.1 selenophosphate synthetase [Capsaspora owczarzaki ATCC 30864]|eukprot:XP_004365215.1 selenophosphate synthetase [Capsaspora owczarzaki ATCC 30864]